MNRCLLLASVGLCAFSFACGSADDGGSGSAPFAGGGGAAEGGTASASAGQSNGAGGTAQPVGTAGSGSGFGGSGSAGTSTVGGSASGGDTSLPVGGSSAGGAGGTGQGGQGQAGSGGSGQAGSGGAPSTPLDPALPPGKNFDLSHFTLQLPVANGNSVQQITNLATYTSQYFFTAKDGAMTFWCPVTGAHTPNTHYPRTELRENATGGDWAITGTHSLTADFKVTKAPPSKGTIIGQIHGNATDGTAEILKLEWMSSNQIVASVEDDNDPATQINKTIGTYTLGEELTYAIKLENSTLTVTITDANGAKSITSPYTAASWKSDKYYFKLGDYVQLNTGADTDGGQVSFYSFAIKHGS